MLQHSVDLVSGFCQIGGGQFNLWTNFLEVNKANIRGIDIKLAIEFWYKDNTWQPKYGYAFFDPSVWHTHRFGLIYTDDIFEQEVNSLLRNHGIIGDQKLFTYSEHGMQGRDYVHFDIVPNWRQTWNKGNQAILGLYDTLNIS